MAVALPDGDGALVRLAIDGDVEAFSALYSRYFPAVFDFLTRLLRNRDEAADIAQDTFIKAMEQLSTIRQPERFKSWLFTIAHRQGLNRIRSSKRATAGSMGAVDDDERATMAIADPDPAVDPEQMAEMQEVADIVWEAAAGLDARTYAVMDLHVRHGLGSAEIAEVMGVSKANAYTMVSRMKRLFSSTLATYLLVRKSREECADLAVIVPADTDAMTPELRKLADRHVARCDVCAENRALLVAPVRIFAGLLLVPVPAALQAGGWAGVVAGAAGAGAATAVAGQGAAGAGAAGAATTGAAGGTVAGASTGVMVGVQTWMIVAVCALGLAAAVAAAPFLLDGDEPAPAVDDGDTAIAPPIDVRPPRPDGDNVALPPVTTTPPPTTAAPSPGPISGQVTTSTTTQVVTPTTTLPPPPTTTTTLPPPTTTTTTLLPPPPPTTSPPPPPPPTTTTVPPPPPPPPPPPTTTVPPTTTTVPPTGPILTRFDTHHTSVRARPAAGDLCPSGPVVTQVSAQVDDPGSVATSALDYRAVIGSTVVSGTLPAYVAGERVAADFSVVEADLHAADHADFALTMRATGVSGGESSIDGVTVRVRSCITLASASLQAGPVLPTGSGVGVRSSPTTAAAVTTPFPLRAFSAWILYGRVEVGGRCKIAAACVS